MGLQINAPGRRPLPRRGGREGVDDPAAAPATTADGDDWGTRIAKLIPAEALGLYGSAVALVPKPAEGDPPNRMALGIIVLAACVLLWVIRWRATKDPVTGKPQMAAILISLVSFLIWLFAIGWPSSPIYPPKGSEYVAALVAMLWGTMVPYFYRGQ